MRFLLQHNEKGVTLVELLVTLGVSAILIVFVVSGSLFIQKYVSNEQQASRLFEELSAISSELRTAIAKANRIQTYSDSLVCASDLNDQVTYSWHDSSFARNGHELLSTSFRLTSVTVEKLELPRPGDSTIYSNVRRYSAGLYRVRVIVADKKGVRDSLTFTVTNEHEKTKFSP